MASSVSEPAFPAEAAPAVRRDPVLPEAYARLKRELAAARLRDRGAYTDGKSEFVLG